MPNQANLTVKKNDGTTDIVYNAVSPSSGDSVAAVWRQDTGNTAPPGMRPRLNLKFRDNGPRTARVLESKFVYPYTYVDSTTGQTKSTDLVLFGSNGTLPQHIPQTVVDEAVSQYFGLMNHPDVRTTVKTGFAPT